MTEEVRKAAWDMNHETICDYCQNEIRPLDKHATSLKASWIKNDKHPTPIQLIEATCVITRTVIAKIEQMK